MRRVIVFVVLLAGPIVAGRQFAPSSGQFVGVAADGEVTTGIPTSAVLEPFSTVGVSVKAAQN